MFNYGGTVTVSWNLVSQSYLTNSSTISWEVKLKFNNANIGVHFATANLSVLYPIFDPYYEGQVGGYISEVKEIFNDDGNIYYGKNGLEQTIASGTYTFTHDIRGNGNFEIMPDFTYYHKDYYAGDEEEPTGTALDPYNGYLDLNLPKISRKVIIDAPNFSDEDNPTVGLQIPTDASWVRLCISFDGETGAIPWRHIEPTSTSYTFNFTDAERETLIKTQLGVEKKKVYFMAEVYYTYGYDEVFEDEYGNDLGSLTEYTKEERVLTIIGYKPTVSPIVEDVNTTTLALTGSKDIIVKYFSNAKFTINAKPSKGATLTYQTASCGGQYSSASNGVFNAVESGTFVFSAGDSRDLLVSQVVEKTFIDYVKLTCNIETEIPELSGYVPITISGNYYNGSFGKVNNTLELKYRYKINDGAYTNWVVVNPTINTGNRTFIYSANVTIPNFNYKDSFVFEAAAADKLISKTITGKRVKTLPVFDWSESDFNFNVPVNFAETANISVDENTSRLNINNKGGIALNENVSINGNGELLLSGTKLNGIINAMTRRYDLPCEVSVGELYSDVSVDLYLYGNTIIGYMSATRKTNVAAGNIANEYVCQVDFDSGGKVTGFGAVSFGSGGEGGLASWVMTNINVYPDDGSVDESQVGKGSFQIILNATGTAGSTFSGYFCFPALLDLNKF